MLIGLSLHDSHFVVDDTKFNENQDKQRLIGRENSQI